ncbi:MAG: hypothetical protein HUU54_02030 [Ignavibacteriaceae bacterium]|nr:hypothetical protein [Ignavibacteriaceae bacterium]
MELIPILATIILMATISTFFLAIGAYILYKIRERRGVQAAAEVPETIKAELVTPESIAAEIQAQVAHRAPAQRVAPAFERPVAPAYRGPAEPIFVAKQATAPGVVVAQQPVQAQAGPAPQPQAAPKAGPAPGPQKFMKYTAEGYVSTKEDKKVQGAVKWR